MSVNSREYYLKHEVFVQVGGMSAYEIQSMGKKYDYARKNAEGIPVFGMIKALNEERRKFSEAYGAGPASDLGDATLEHMLKHENILSKRILNQAKLGMLILKDEASDRVKKILRAVMTTIKVGIRHASTRIVASKPQSPRDVEQILTEEWNDAIDELRKGAKIISWEKDGATSLLQTRLQDLEPFDPEFVGVVRAKQNERQD